MNSCIYLVQADRSLAVLRIQKLIFHECGPTLTALQEDVKAEYQKFVQLNEDSSRKLCTDAIQHLHAPVLQASQAGKYAVPGGYKLYKDDIQTLKDDYKKSQARGCMILPVFREFIEQQEPRRREILATDKALNKHAKDLAGWKPCRNNHDM